MGPAPLVAEPVVDSCVDVAVIIVVVVVFLVDVVVAASVVLARGCCFHCPCCRC